MYLGTSIESYHCNNAVNILNNNIRWLRENDFTRNVIKTIVIYNIIKTVKIETRIINN